MKHFKMKAGMLALALACACTGVAMLQSNSVDVSATTASGDFYMENGAAVSLEDEFSGIRWTTVVESGYYNSLEKTPVQFGAIVAPTSAFTGELTHETDLNGQNLMDIPVDSTVDASASDFTYYSVVNYDDIVEDYKAANPNTDKTDADILKAAYKLELTARAYVKFEDGTYAYADVQNTSRSARQVANAAELSGELATKSDEKEAKGKSYMVGNETRYATPANAQPAVVDMSAPTTTVTASIEDFSGTVEEVLIGGNRVAATVSGTTVTITDATYSPEGETHLSLINTDGDIYSTPIISATKVLKTADDLDIFGMGAADRLAKTEEYNGTLVSDLGYTYLFVDADGVAVKEQDGYYVLGNDIDASSYVHKINANGANCGVDAASNSNGGLTGTFNGMGYTVSGLTVGDTSSETTGYGIFDLINGGTVKNVAFTGVNYAEINSNFTFAFNAYDATLDNVYVQVNGLTSKATKGTLFNNTKNCTFTNCIVELGEYVEGGADEYVGSFVGRTMNKDTISLSNCYVLSPTALNNEGGTVIDEVEGIKRYNDVVEFMDDTKNDLTSFNSLYWNTEDGCPIWNGIEYVKVNGMFSEKDGLLINYDGSNDVSLTTVVGENATIKQNGTTLDVTDGKVDVTPLLFKDNGYTDVAYVTLQATVAGVTTNYLVKAYTLVIDDANDLQAFTFQIGYADASANQKYTFASKDLIETAIFDGYYILAEDISGNDGYGTEENPHTHSSYTSGFNANGQNKVLYMDGTTQATSDYLMEDLGLTGTFDGNGYTVSDMYMKNGGLFGVVGEYGMVKNVAFKNITNAAASSLLYYVFDSAKLSNVYLEATVESNTYTNVALSNWIKGSVIMENVIVKAFYEKTLPTSLNTSRTYMYGFVGGVNTSYMPEGVGTLDSWSNVYVIDENALVLYAQKTDTWTVYDAAIVDGVDNTASGTLIAGCERYTEALPTTEGKYAAFDNGYWDISSGSPVWNS